MPFIVQIDLHVVEEKKVGFKIKGNDIENKNVILQCKCRILGRGSKKAERRRRSWRTYK